MEPQPVISVRDVVNRFGSQVVHDGVSLDVQRGEVFGIVGGSGSGKTVLLTAIIVAGRTGSAYAAEIGVMQLNDEVDALESMGLDPYEVLVLPRVLGLMISLPLLTIVADFMGLAGGGLLTHYLTDLPWPQFLTRLDEAVGRTTFWAGLIKAPVFGLLIGLTGTLRGLQVRDSSRELGRLTTVAVVQSIFVVIFADAMFAVFYLEIDF